MKKLNTTITRVLLASVIIAAAAPMFLARAQNAEPNPALTSITASINPSNVATHTYIVTLRREADQDGCVKDLGIKRGMSWRHALNGFTADLDDAAVKQLKEDKRVLAVELDGEVTPCFYTLPQFIPNGVLRIGVSNFPVAQFSQPGQSIDVDVAVIDGGIDINHPELNVFKSVDLTGESILYSAKDPHGTEVAGIIGARNDNVGIIGVAPGVRLWSVRIFPDTIANTWDMTLAGFDYVATNADKISVVNCSFGPSATSIENASVPVVAVEQAVHQLVSEGVVVVASAGNSTIDLAGLDEVMSTFDTNGNPITISGDDFVPASLPEVMAVSAMDPATDTIADFSNFSSVQKIPSYAHSPGLGIDVAAPGVNIYTTDSSVGQFGTVTAGYSLWNASGTSFSAPHVVGLVALYIAANGRATNAAGVFKIRQAIIDTALPQSQWNTNNTHDPDNYPEPLAMASPDWIPKPNIVSQGNTNGTVQLNFAAVPGYSYAAQYRDELSSGQWTNLSGSVIGIGSVAPTSVNDSNPNPSSRFYRLAMSPAPAALLVTNAGAAGFAENAYASDVQTNQPGLNGSSYRFLNPRLSVKNTDSYVIVPQARGWPYIFSNNPSPFPLLNPAGAFTVEFWAKPAQLVNDMFCPAASLDNSQASVTNGWIFYLTPENEWQFSVGGGTNGFTATVAGGTAQANVWQHIVGMYDGTSISLYINGVLVAGPSLVSNFAPNLSQPLRFGAACDGTRTFDGWLDEPAIYTNALNASQISAHFNAVTTNNAGYSSQILSDGPVGYWHFD